MIHIFRSFNENIETEDFNCNPTFGSHCSMFEVIEINVKCSCRKLDVCDATQHKSKKKKKKKEKKI